MAGWRWFLLISEKLVFIGLLLTFKWIRDLGLVTPRPGNDINRYWLYNYRITLKYDKATLAQNITNTIKIYGREEARMFNLTRMVFYLESGLGLKTTDFIELICKLDRITTIKYTLLYLIDDIASRTALIVSESFKHYRDFGIYYVNLDLLPAIPDFAKNGIKFY